MSGVAVAPRPHVRPHPAKGVLALRRITQRELADALGFSYWELGRMLNGIRPATPRFRRGLSEYLDVPQRELFHQDQA